jgi:pyruvate dehydrogenase E1 component alpha subunit
VTLSVSPLSAGSSSDAQQLGPELLRVMLRIRLFEEALYRLFMTGTMPGTMHQAIGQEAVAAGVGLALRPDDLMTSTHRGHGHAIAKGVPMRAIMAEMFARQTGASGGMGGSLHIFDVSRGFLGSTGIVGAGVPIAAGAALAGQLEGSDRVVVSFFGEGAANQGAVHEAINICAIWHLPVVLVCENNRYAVSMPAERAFAIEHVAQRGQGYGIPAVTIDGNDVFAVHTTTSAAIARARTGEGPTLIECETYRFKGHSRFEPGKYRPPGELEERMRHDPIELLRERLTDQAGLSREALEDIRAEVETEVADAISFARSSTPASAETARSLAFAEVAP